MVSFRPQPDRPTPSDVYNLRVCEYLAGGFDPLLATDAYRTTDACAIVAASAAIMIGYDSAFM